jgi:hypothetical protein
MVMRINVMGRNDRNSSHREAEAGGSQLQASLGYTVRLCFKKQTNPARDRKECKKGK